MWRIESLTDDAGAPYDRRAALYDRLVRSRVYNRLAWSASPAHYEDFAAAAFAHGDGPLLELAAGTAAATAALHAKAERPTVLVDLSRAMLERAAERIAAHAGTGDALPPHVRLVQADLFALPFAPASFTTVLGLGVTHLFDDTAALVAAGRAPLTPDGALFLAGLTAQTRRGRGYLNLLHRAGEVARPRSAADLRAELRPAEFHVNGCMAYARQTTATGSTIEPVAPRIASGSATNRNSRMPAAASASKSRLSRM